MKPIRLFLLPLVFLAAPLLRADGPNLLLNGDFSDGSAHWDGDARRPDTGETDPLAAPSSAPQGVMIKLRGSDWSKVSQDFSCQGRVISIKVLYKISADATFSNRPEDYANVPAAAMNSSLNRAEPLEVGQWAIFVDDVAAKKMWTTKVSPAMNTDAVQTAVGRVRVKPGDLKGIFLAFPPGSGTVTLLSVTVVAGGEAGSDDQQ